MHRLDSIAAKLVRLGSEAAKASDQDAADGPRAAVAAILRETTSGDGAELFFVPADLMQRRGAEQIERDAIFAF